VYPNTAAERAGLRRGDVIVGVDEERGLGQPEVIRRIGTSGGRAMRFTIERDGRPLEMSIRPTQEGDRAVLGVVISMYEVRRVDPSVFEALQMSVEQNWATTLLIGRTLRGLVTRETPVRQLMGPVAIAELSGSAAELGWRALFGLMAMISLNLGLLNLLPVPVLDGGHIMILAVEGLARRDLSLRVKERVLMAGAAVIVLLMVTVIFNDIARLLR
jgi:regulator of sigma E protease